MGGIDISARGAADEDIVVTVAVYVSSRADRVAHAIATTGAEKLESGRAVEYGLHGPAHGGFAFARGGTQHRGGEQLA